MANQLKFSFYTGKALFGEAYSGLEYDYRGLLRLYHSTGNNNLALHFSNILQQWNQLRDQSNATEAKPLDFDVYDSLENIIQKHFLSWQGSAFGVVGIGW